MVGSGIPVFAAKRRKASSADMMIVRNIIILRPKKVAANRGMIRFQASAEESNPPVMTVRMEKCQHKAAMTMFPETLMDDVNFKAKGEARQTSIMTKNMLMASVGLPILCHLIMLGMKKR